MDLKRGVVEAVIMLAITMVVGVIMVVNVVQPILNAGIQGNSTVNPTNLSAYSAAQTVGNQLPTLNIVILLVMFAGGALMLYRMAGG